MCSCLILIWSDSRFVQSRPHLSDTYIVAPSFSYRLAEFLRRQFEARIRDRRAMMIAVGGEISVDKNVAVKVPDLLGLPQFRIKTLNNTGQELSDDPLGLRRRPIGQR